MTSRFETRITTGMLAQLRSHAECLATVHAAIARRALETLLKRYTKGFFVYRERSDFLTRPGKTDKVRFEVRLERGPREMLRRLAYLFRISQAELLRVALEYYVYCLGPSRRATRSRYSRKNRYAGKTTVPGILLQEMFTPAECRYYHVDHYPEYELQFLFPGGP